MNWVRVALAGIAVLALATLRLGAAPNPNALPPYTGEQARLGQTLFYENCAECHGDALQGNFGPALAGGDDNLRWTPVYSTWEYMTAHMPAGNAGGLTQEQYVDVMAFLLKAHGELPSRVPLTAGSADASKVPFGPP